LTLRQAQGRFVTLEGGEGVGKSTQARRLAEALRARGLDVVLTREPGGTPGAEAIRALLMEGESDRWSARTEALLFAAARADHVERLIRPALERGAWVVCDRFVDSTRAYQGLAGGISDAEIMQLHAIGSGGLLPDRTLLLHMPIAAASSRVLHRDGPAADRFAVRDIAFFDRVGEAFAELAAAEPARFRGVDASGSEAQVTERLLAALGDLTP
jgi:dTMP kinase